MTVRVRRSMTIRVRDAIPSRRSSGQCEPHPETRPRLAHRALASPRLALIAIQELRKLCRRRRIGLRVARARRQPAQLYPMQQPVGTRQAAINLKRLLPYALRIDCTKRHYPVPLQLGAGDNPFVEPRARHGVHPWLATRARPVAQSLNAFLLAVMPLVSRCSAAPGSLRKKYAGIVHPPNMVRLPSHSTTSGDHRKLVLDSGDHRAKWQSYPLRTEFLIFSVRLYRREGVCSREDAGFGPRHACWGLLNSRFAVAGLRSRSDMRR